MTITQEQAKKIFVVVDEATKLYWLGHIDLDQAIELIQGTVERLTGFQAPVDSIKGWMFVKAKQAA